MAAKPRKNAEETAPDLAAFEASLQELEAVVQRMEHGEQPLEESLRDFERGVSLIRQCQAMLQSAQQRVDTLTRDGRLTDFTADDAQ
ncbi:MAG: exodeoxyribonuclease VII small subunit [Pseudomonadota bacterium]